MMERTQAYEGRIDWLSNALEMTLDILVNDESYSFGRLLEAYTEEYGQEEFSLVECIYFYNGQILKKYIKKYGFYEVEALMKEWHEKLIREKKNV